MIFVLILVYMSICTVEIIFIGNLLLVLTLLLLSFKGNVIISSHLPVHALGPAPQLIYNGCVCSSIITRYQVTCTLHSVHNSRILGDAQTDWGKE